jgi:hypothetical protein
VGFYVSKEVSEGPGFMLRVGPTYGINQGSIADLGGSDYFLSGHVLTFGGTVSISDSGTLGLFYNGGRGIGAIGGVSNTWSRSIFGPGGNFTDCGARGWAC